MFKLRLTGAIVLSAIIVISTACGGAGSSSGGTAPDGSSVHSSIFVSKSAIAPGATCANGGVQIDMGFDNNGNGVLDTAEITQTDYVCNGKDSLIKVTSEPAGSNCHFGGQKIETGLDTNGNNVLDAAEIQSSNTSYICDADPGTTPYVIYSTPQPNLSAARNEITKFDFYFNEVMDPATIIAANVMLKDEKGNTIPSTIVHNEKHVTITPNNKLPLGKVTAHIYQNVKSISGAAMQFNYQCTVNLNLAWGTPQMIENSTVPVISRINAETLSSYYPPLRLATDPSGNIAAIWMQDGLRANSYTPGSGWGTSQSISTGTPYFNLAIDAIGNVTFVYLQSDGTRDNLWAMRYTSGSGWGTAQLIETNNAGSVNMYYKIATDDTGNATVVWSQSDGTRDNLWANRFSAGSWGTAQLIETDNAGSVIYSNFINSYTNLAIDTAGNVTAVWAQSDGTRDNIWANRFSAGSWGTAQLIETDNSGRAIKPEIVCDIIGNVTAIWAQYDGTRDNLWANRFSAGSWGTAQMIETDNSAVGDSGKLVVDTSGIVTAVWLQSGLRTNRCTAGIWGIAQPIDTNTSINTDFSLGNNSIGNITAVWTQTISGSTNLCANSYIPGSGWGSPFYFDNSTYGFIRLKVAIDSAGYATAVWTEFDSTGTRQNLYADCYTPGNGWGTPLLLKTKSSTADIYRPSIGIDPAGNATVIWPQDDGNNSINMWATSIH